MVLLHIKHNDESQFLYESSLKTPVDDLVRSVVAIYNGRLKIDRICCEIQELSKHGTLYPPEILGLTDDQVDDLKLVDVWGDKCTPSGGFTTNKDPIGRRNGKQPTKQMQEVLSKTVDEAKALISKDLVLRNQAVTMKVVQKCLDLLKGAVTIVYPMKLPPHDVIRMEFENVEDLTGTQAALEVIDGNTAKIWFCGKEMYRDGKVVGDYVGKIENCKVIMKISKPGQGAPGREPIMNEEQRKQMMLHAYRKQEELKKMMEDDDDTYFDSKWADGGNLKRAFHGMDKISWRPGK